MSGKTIKLKFIKSLYPYTEGEIVDFQESRYTDLVKDHTEIVKKGSEKIKEKTNKGILTPKSTK